MDAQYITNSCLAGQSDRVGVKGNGNGSNGRRTLQVNLVGEIATLAGTSNDIDDFLHATSRLIRTAFDFHEVKIWAMCDSQEDLPHLGFANKLQNDELSRRSDHPSLSDCTSRNSTLCAEVDEAGPGRRLVVPIHAAGRFLGQLTVEHDGVSAPSQDQRKTIKRVASVIALEFNKYCTQMHARRTSQYMDAIISAAQDQAIMATDPHGYVITASNGVQSVFQLSPKDILGSDVLALFTDVHLQRDLALYISKGETRILKRSKVPQGTGSACFLDIAFQSIPSAEKATLGYLAIIRDVTQIVLLNERLEALSITDELTGLYNKRHFITSLESEIERSLRYNRKFSLCFLDLDGFKLINDTQGHLRGDLILKEAASLLKTDIRAQVDTCYRYGGDEFTIIMPETRVPMAKLACERIRRHLKEHFCDKPAASIGIAQWASSMRAKDLVEAADRAMYSAKACGGNAIMLAPNVD